jgi:hypothetical protein
MHMPAFVLGLLETFEGFQFCCSEVFSGETKREVRSIHYAFVVSPALRSPPVFCHLEQPLLQLMSGLFKHVALLEARSTGWLPVLCESSMCGMLPVIGGSCTCDGRAKIKRFLLPQLINFKMKVIRDAVTVNNSRI